MVLSSLCDTSGEKKFFPPPLPLAHPSLATTCETPTFSPVALDPSAEPIDSRRIPVTRGYPNLFQRW